MTLSAIVALLGFTDLGIRQQSAQRGRTCCRARRPSAIRVNVSNGIVMLLAVAAVFGLLFAVVYDHIPWAQVFDVGSASALGEVGPAAAVLVVCFLIGLPAGALPQVRLGLQQGYVNSLFVGIGNILGLAFVIWAIRMQLGLPWLAATAVSLLATLVNGFDLAMRTPWRRRTPR